MNSNYGSTVGEGESDENGDSDFEILLHFKVEQTNKINFLFTFS